MVGIVLLVAISIYLIQSESIELADQERQIVESVAEEFSVVQQYVSECIRTVGREGLRLLGAHGGYINPSQFGMVANRQNPTQGDGVYLSSLSDNFVPYWRIFIVTLTSPSGSMHA